MNTDTPLSPDQILIIATAARRSDRMVVPRPAGLRARGAVRQRLLAAMLERGLVEELPSKDDVDEGLAWRRDERGRHRALRLTSAGHAMVARRAAGPEAGSGEGRARRRLVQRASPTADKLAAPEREVRPGENVAAAPAPEPRLGGKLGRVLDAVGAEDGATLAELAGLTGGLPHTPRAALTRLRRRGYALERLDLNGRKAYRLGATR